MYAAHGYAAHKRYKCRHHMPGNGRKKKRPEGAFLIVHCAIACECLLYTKKLPAHHCGGSPTKLQKLLLL